MTSTSTIENGTQVQLPAHIASMIEKALSLFADGTGYWAVMRTPNLVTIIPPQSAPGRYVKNYEINLPLRTCTCECFYGGKIRTKDGRRTCKHLTGLFILAEDCERWNRDWYEMQASELLAGADWMDRRKVHMGWTLAETFGVSPRTEAADKALRDANRLRKMIETFGPGSSRDTTGERKAA